VRFWGAKIKICLDGSQDFKGPDQKGAKTGTASPRLDLPPKALRATHHET